IPARNCAKATVTVKHRHATRKARETRVTLNFICRSHTATKSSYFYAGREYSKPVSGCQAITLASRRRVRVLEMKSIALPIASSKRRGAAMKSWKCPMAKPQKSIFFSGWPLLISLVFVTVSACYGNTEYYRHTFFDNALNTDAYFYSAGNSTGGSFLELKDSRLPLDNIDFLTPPN